MERSDADPADAGASPIASDATLRRVLVGYDGSEAAGVASSFGLYFAGKGHARLTLLHVSDDDPRAEDIASPELLVAVAERRREEDRHWHEELANLRAYAATDASVETIVVPGNGAKTLLEEARARVIDLILVGSTGVGTVRGTFLGSVSSQVIEHASCSVMVFREGQPASPAHTQAIIAGIDGSPASRAVVALAAELARSLDAKLVLVHAFNPNFALGQHVAELRRELREEGAEILRSARGGIAKDVVVDEELIEGRAREQLVGASERFGPAVLVVGSRGLGGFKGLLLGSTSRWVVNHAPCPVTVVRRS